MPKLSEEQNSILKKIFDSFQKKEVGQADLDKVCNNEDGLKKSISNKSAIMAFTPVLAKTIKRWILPSQKKSVRSFFLLTVGEIVPSLHLAMIHSNVLAAERQCFSLSFTIIISIFLWTKCMKEPWDGFRLILLHEAYTFQLRLC